MDVRKWPINRIMQLPDCCFGTRFGVFCRVRSADATPTWDISEISLPDQCVIWEVGGWMSRLEYTFDTFRLALGDHLPTTLPEMNEMEPLLHGLGAEGAEPRVLDAPYEGAFVIPNLKLLVAAQGRKLIVEGTSIAGQFGLIQVYIVVSSIPKEVPDWLVSGQGSHLA